jgi:predicted nucleic acid-binding protein
MTAKFFADTNVVLYTIGLDKRKTDIARNLIKTEIAVSTQVINECMSVCLRKFGFTKEKSYYFTDNIMRRSDVIPVDEATVRKSADIAIKNQISNWDALIIAAALLADCDILYSEDMQNGQIFDNRLVVVNPFL